MTIREQAEEMRLSLIMGLLETADVIAWADGLVGSEPSPPAWLLDVSLAANETAEAIEARLRDIPCEENLAAVAYSVIGRLEAAFRSGEVDPTAAARMLELWAASARISQDDWSKAMLPTWIADDAMHGIFGRDDIVAAVNESLAYFLTVAQVG